MTLSRPLLRWHGGKWRLAPWIIQHFPPHRCYVEPFGGAASVLLRKPRSYAEIYNDLDDDVVNLFRVLRSPEADRLVEMVRLTPFARSEFLRAYEHTTEPAEAARRLIIRSFMGFGSNAHMVGVTTGFRAASHRSGTTPGHDWANYPVALAAVIDRLTGVVIENRNARHVMTANDGPSVLHYLDPPYLPETRSQKTRRGVMRYHTYNHELTDDDHAELLAHASTMRGSVVISGYPSRIYDDVLQGWRRVERPALADGARARTEVLWINQRAADAAGGLFATTLK